MTQLQTMSDQELNRKLADLMGYTLSNLQVNDTIISTEIDGEYHLQSFDPCKDPTASLEVQAKALEVDAAAYIQHLDFRVIPSGCREQWGYDEVKLLLTATPRERAEAAYMTLQAGK